jgi:hypothetical protein
MRFFFNKPSTAKAFPDQPLVVDETLDVEMLHIDKEIASVIALAIHMHLAHVREYEEATITMQRIMKPYSPWSSKIYGLRQAPQFIPNLRSRLK